MKKSLRDRMIALRRLGSRLARDVAGNTLAIVAAAIIPLAALVGSGIDMSRAYMAQARLQMACDAGALAGRRVMSGSTVDSTVRTEALKFFRFNFPTGESGTTPPYNVASFVPTVPDGTDGIVRINASTTVPTTLMAMFGYNTIPISVTCFAQQDFVNTDIILVLDNTGSMADDVNNNYVGNNAPSKIAGLRTAVLALYDQLAPVQAQLALVGLRLRYGIVPYSTSVNAGAAIRAVDPNYLVNNWNYQSKVALYDTPIYTAHPGTPTVTTETYSSPITKANCRAYGDNLPFGSFNPSPSGDYDDGAVAPSPVTSTTFSRDTWNGSSSMSGGGSTTATCTRTKSVVVTTYTSGGGYSFTKWIYRQANYDVSNFKTNSSINLANNTSGVMPSIGYYTPQQMAQLGSGFSTTNTSWDGCVEERDTVSTITGTTTSTPSGAKDLDIDMIPSDDASRWRPIWDNIEYSRNSSGSSNPTADASTGSLVNAACPAEAKPLQTWTRTDLNTYLNSMVANGSTYHDIGMIWGARFLSGNGIFGASNPSTYNGMPVARFIIFMTDGIMAPTASVYSAYGIEYLDKRVTGGYTNNTDQIDRHNKRFELACQAAKTQGVSIWVISFASALSTQLTNCASRPSQASVSSDVNSLVAKFAEIGKNIGALRLTQ